MEVMERCLFQCNLVALKGVLSNDVSTLVRCSLEFFQFLDFILRLPLKKMPKSDPIIEHILIFL